MDHLLPMKLNPNYSSYPLYFVFYLILIIIFELRKLYNNQQQIIDNLTILSLIAPANIIIQMLQEYRHADQIIKPDHNNAVWIGDVQAAENIDWLKQNNIRTVITAADGFNFKYDSSIRHIKYLLLDKKTQNIMKILDDAADKIQRNIKFGSILVHCGAGVSRSTTLVIGYLIKYRKMNFISALKLTKQKRPVVCPNLGFQLQLKSFQKLLLTRTAMKHSNIKTFQLPQLLVDKKYLNTQINNGQNYGIIHKNQLKINRGKLYRQNSTMHKSVHPKQVKDIQALKKIALFRFGLTNTEKWKIN